MDYYSAFGEVLLFIIAGLLFVIGGLFTAFLIRPNRPNPDKLESYESGEQPLGDAWVRFPIRYYVIAIIFLLFEVEIIFIFPWAVVFGDAELIEATDGLWGWLAVSEMFIFIAVLALGLAYVWKRGFLDWPKPQTGQTRIHSPVPDALYQTINKKYE